MFHSILITHGNTFVLIMHFVPESCLIVLNAAKLQEITAATLTQPGQTAESDRRQDKSEKV